MATRVVFFAEMRGATPCVAILKATPDAAIEMRISPAAPAAVVASLMYDIGRVGGRAMTNPEWAARIWGWDGIGEQMAKVASGSNLVTHTADLELSDDDPEMGVEDLAALAQFTSELDAGDSSLFLD